VQAGIEPVVALLPALRDEDGTKWKTMTKQPYSVHIITAWKVPEIMVALLDGPLYFSELVKITGGSNTTVGDRLKHLVEAGLVREKRDEHLPFRRVLSLTPLGVKTAQALKKLSDMARRKS